MLNIRLTPDTLTGQYITTTNMQIDHMVAPGQYIKTTFAGRSRYYRPAPRGPITTWRQSYTDVRARDAAWLALGEMRDAPRLSGAPLGPLGAGYVHVNLGEMPPALDFPQAGSKVAPR